jgi:hypothetical protein
MKVVVYLTGAREGKTILLRRYNFVEGRYVVDGTAQEAESTLRYLRRVYQAMPAEEYRTWKEAQDGVQHNPSEVAGQRCPEGVQGGERESAGQVSSVGDVLSDKPVGAEGGGAGVGSSGSGHSDAGLQPNEIAKIRKAMSVLDVKNDAHWTAEGQPSVEALSEMLRDQGITRRVIDAVDAGFTREKVAEVADL